MHTDARRNPTRWIPTRIGSSKCVTCLILREKRPFGTRMNIFFAVALLATTVVMLADLASARIHEYLAITRHVYKRGPTPDVIWGKRGPKINIPRIPDFKSNFY
ncbi:hypothetical protein Y032_0046g1393 [Ancylostoma ceylanicum]|uniref:Uncharacterized protein n=1 Tax=Ancylostoma ceylanicum TaxID=53326 RepID=A0A016UC43_9BILA|nr:hypothetical protein Y032_0046g1393 [Ancylostoma ceylanicum]